MSRQLRGVVLAGGTGSRLDPLTRVVNKHLLPVYDRPMVYYAIEHLRACGVERLMLVTGSKHLSAFQRLLGSGAAFGLDELAFAAQARPGGIAEALGLAEEFVGAEIAAVCLADNVFEWSAVSLAETLQRDPRGAGLVLAEVDDPRPYGVAEMRDGRIVRVVEKPRDPPSSIVVTGMYFFPPDVFEVIRRLRPSARGEREISDVVDQYVAAGEISHVLTPGYWIDCGGSFDALLRAGYLVATHGANKVAHRPDR